MNDPSPLLVAGFKVPVFYSSLDKAFGVLLRGSPAVVELLADELNDLCFIEPFAKVEAERPFACAFNNLLREMGHGSLHRVFRL